MYAAASGTLHAVLPMFTLTLPIFSAACSASARSVPTLDPTAITKPFIV
jgi:hypothetical protein